MKNIPRRLISFLLVLGLSLSLSFTLYAAPGGEWNSVYTLADPALPNSRVNAQTVNGKLTLFLPTNLSATAVSLYAELSEPCKALSVTGSLGAANATDGQPVDLVKLCGEADSYTVILQARTASGTYTQELTLIPSGNIAGMYLVSDDPENEGRVWIESSPDKSNKTTGSMVLVAPDGITVYNGALTQIKGRGNSTWKRGAKKPYQIKLAEKTDLLQTGDKENKAKTWVLLASNYDPALIRNSITFDLAAALGMEYYCEYRPVNLFYDGEYRGLYLLCEKVEVKSGRVDLTDLEGANEDANPDVEDLTALPTARGTTVNGASYFYCEGLKNPEDITGGYLLEMDMAARAAEEKCYFITTRGNYIVVKSPECCSKEQMDYIASLYQDFEDAVYNGGVNSRTGKSYTDYVTLESIVQCYIINEYSKNPDNYVTSAFLYKEAGSDVMKMGPVWDYDIAYGIGSGTNDPEAEKPTGLFTAYYTFAHALYGISSFRAETQRQYAAVEPLISDVLCGESGSSSGKLRAFVDYRDSIAVAARCNYMIWDVTPFTSGHLPGGTTWQSNCAYLENFLKVRNAFLKEEFASWSTEEYTPLGHFMDVPHTAWYFDSVEAAANYGLMQGKGCGLFDPNAKTTRAEAAQLMYNIGAANSGLAEQLFSDVPVTAWYARAVTWANKNHLILGYPDGSFRPSGLLTRQDMMVLLYRYSGEPEVSGIDLSSFADSASVAGYARTALQWAVKTGLLKGYDDNTIRPNAHITRAELATLIQRYHDNVLKA